jgi:protoporphyrinogen oxidase
VVLGAGPAGVGAAYRAARAGHRVTLVERADRVGGAAGSHTVAGVRVDLGSHRLHPTIEPRILEELRGLLGADLQLRPRRGRIRLGGRWIAFPLRPLDLVRRLPPAVAAGAVRDAVLGFRRPPPRADTFEEVLRAALGPTLCERFYFPYARKLWGVEPSELSGEQARRRVGARSPSRMVARALARGGAGGRAFLYPRRGYGQLWEALADGASRAGAEVLLGAEARRLELRPDGATVTLADGRALEARRVWSTLPAPALARMADPAPPEGALAAAAALEYRAMALVYLVLPRRRYTGYDAHYLPDGATPVTRVSEPRNYRDGADPDGVTVLCAEIPCAGAGGLVDAPDGVLGELAADGLAEAGLPRPEVAAVEVARLRHAYPVLRAGVEAHLAALERWTADQPALLTLGRQALFVHDNAHHALAMAWAAADCLGRDGAFDDDAWARARRRFAAHVVED